VCYRSRRTPCITGTRLAVCVVSLLFRHAICAIGRAPAHGRQRRSRGRLDCKHPEMMSAAKKLIAMGQEDSKQNWVNTYIQGRRLRADVVENDSMFQFLTRDFTHPVLELDYCGADFAELCLLWENRRSESDRRAWVATLTNVVEPLRCEPGAYYFSLI
jgi:hypothetical protein